MMEQLKSTLLGAESRTDGGWTDADHGSTGVDGDAVGEVDPFRPATDVPDGPDGDRVAMDEIFGVLGNQRRRYVVAYMSMAEGTVTMSDLAEQVAAWECGKEIPELGSQERKRVYISLYQCHLPKMDDASAISYDKDRGEIERGPQFGPFSHYLRSDY